MESPGSTSADISQAPTQTQVQLPPVLEERKAMKVMVAVDESDEGFYALQWVLDTLFPAKPVTGTRPEEPSEEEVGMITVVHVTFPFQPYVLPAGPAIFATTSMIESVRKAQQKIAADLLSRALQFCKHRMIKVETLVLEGDAKDMICQAAEQTHVDLLVVGSRGLGKVKRAFLGSVSDYCAHHAKCPVLIVKPPKELQATKGTSLDTNP